MSEVERIDFDLDVDVADVADLINFINPVPGRHVYVVAFCGMDKIGKEEDAAIGVRIVYQKLGTLEKTDETSADTPDASVFAENFTGNKMGKQFLKARLKQFFGDVEGSFRPYIESLQDSAGQNQFVLTTSITKSTSNGKTYENVRINEIELLDTPIDLPDGFELFEYEPKLD